MTTLASLVGTKWVGNHELWQDPLGNEASRGEATMTIEDGRIRYTWQLDGKSHEGELALRESGAMWTDSWHQSKPTECMRVRDAWGLLAVSYTYGAPGSPDWGWRTTLAQRPTGELVLQMTNVAPWGEEARAVRMIFTRA